MGSPPRQASDKRAFSGNRAARTLCLNRGEAALCWSRSVIPHMGCDNPPPRRRSWPTRHSSGFKNCCFPLPFLLYPYFIFLVLYLSSSCPFQLLMPCVPAGGYVWLGFSLLMGVCSSGLGPHSWHGLEGFRALENQNYSSCQGSEFISRFSVSGFYLTMLNNLHPERVPS